MKQQKIMKHSTFNENQICSPLTPASITRARSASLQWHAAPLLGSWFEAQSCRCYAHYAALHILLRSTEHYCTISLQSGFNRFFTPLTTSLCPFCVSAQTISVFETYAASACALAIPLAIVSIKLRGPRFRLHMCSHTSLKCITEYSTHLK